MLHAGCRIRVVFQPTEWPLFDLNVKTKTTHRIFQSYTLDFANLGCSRTKLSEINETSVLLFVGLQVQDMMCPFQPLL